MSFLRYAGRQYTNQSREEQFIRYLRDTGASKALQKAMILLFKMPIKPTNLAEFFAEYLENGAQDLVNLSILKAELCYKHSETQNIHRSIQSLQNQIDNYESQGYGKSKPKHEYDHDHDHEDVQEKDPFFLEEDQDPIKYSLLDRFLGDLGAVSESERSSAIQLNNKLTSAFEQEEANFWGEGINGIFGGEEVPEIEEIEESLKVKEQNSLTNWTNEVKKLDPWGIVCRTTKTLSGRPSGETEDDIVFAQGDTNRISLAEGVLLEDLKENQVFSEIASSNESDPEDKKYAESDDAETLAEIYHLYATAFDKLPPPQPDTSSIPMHHLHRHTHHLQTDLRIPHDKDKDVKLLTVAQPSKGTDPTLPPRKLADMMGWSRNFCVTNREPLSKALSIFPKPNWSQFTEIYQDDPDDSPVGDPCLEGVDFYRDIKWQDDAQKAFPISAKDESFLLDYDMARIARKLDPNDDPGFMFEFNQKFENATPQEKDHICGHCKKAMSSKPRPSQEKVDAATSTSHLLDWEQFCQCGEDCSCLCNEDDMVSPIPRGFHSLPPGKMANWTKDYTEYPGETTDAEDGSSRNSEGGALKYSNSMGQFLQEFVDMEFTIKDVKSDCYCGELSTGDVDVDSIGSDPIFPEECHHYCKITGSTTTLIEEPQPQGHAPPKLSRRTTLDPELEKAFREGGGYAGSGGGEKEGGKRQKSWIQKDVEAVGRMSKQKIIKGDEFNENQVPYPLDIDVYNTLDYEKNVQRMFGSGESEEKVGEREKVKVSVIGKKVERRVGSRKVGKVSHKLGKGYPSSPRKKKNA